MIYLGGLRTALVEVSLAKRLFVITVLFILSLCPVLAVAGNHEVIHPTTGHSIGWENPEKIPYWVDKGELGILSNSQARAIVEAMMKRWSAVETARVGFEYQGNLPDDVNEENISDYLAAASCGSSGRSDIPANVVPIVFDANGKIIEYLIGRGSSSEVGGLATLRCFVGTLSDPKAIYQGMVIINGRFIDGKGSVEGSPLDLPVNVLAGVILHELGHLIGLDHSAVNMEIYDLIAAGDLSPDESRYLPVMLPTVLRTSTSSTTLHPDDVSAISTLYPADGYLSSVGRIEGEVVDAERREVRKANVVARREDDPLCEAVASLSGRKCTPLTNPDGSINFYATHCENNELYGDYEIDGLLPGSYTVEVEEPAAGWISSSLYPSDFTDGLPGDAEFYNEGDIADESPYDYTLVDVVGGEAVRGIDFVLGSGGLEAGRLASIPLGTFESGPASRCREDPVDLTTWLSDIGEDISALLDKPARDVTAGGCQLVRTSDIQMGGMIMITVLLSISLFAVRFLHFLSNAVVKICPPRAKLRCAGHKSTLIIFVIISELLLYSATSGATSIVPQNLEGMAAKAGKIFHGYCVNTEVRKDERGLVSTFVTYRVLRGVKGVEGKTVTFKMFGAAAKTENSATPAITGLSGFYEGREDILFLYDESPWGFTSPIGIWQGSFPVFRAADGPRVIVPHDAVSVGADLRFKAAGGLDSDDMATPDSFLDIVEDLLKNSSQSRF